MVVVICPTQRQEGLNTLFEYAAAAFTINNDSAVLWFLLQFIHRWVEYCGTLVDNSSLTLKFWVALICFKNKKGVMHVSMIQVEFVPLIMKDGTCTMQSFDRACPMSMIERLIIFLLSDHNFWLQRCSIAADMVYIFEGLSRNELRPFSIVNGLLLTGYIVIPILIQIIKQ